MAIDELEVSRKIDDLSGQISRELYLSSFKACETEIESTMVLAHVSDIIEIIKLLQSQITSLKLRISDLERVNQS
jgi:hypothetical protein